MTIGLPKWPQMLVLGQKVDHLYAEEIIRRTDSFFGYFSGGNNRQFDKWIRELLGMPIEQNGKGFGDYMQEFEAWREQWGVIDTEYVRNDWVSCCFLHGPHGWMAPDGTIAFVDNVGKWPSVESIHDDWKKLATAFPDVKLDGTLWSGEQCEDDKIPLVGFMVRDGDVEIVSPRDARLYRDFDVASVEEAQSKAYELRTRDVDEALKAIFGEEEPDTTILTQGVKSIPLSREQGIHLDILERWRQKAVELNLIKQIEA